MKYKKGQRIWGKVYNNTKERKELIYIGPVTVISRTSRWEGRERYYNIRCPVTVYYRGKAFQDGMLFLMAEDAVEHEI